MEQNGSEKKPVPIVELKNVSALSQNSPDKIVVRGVNWTVYENDFWVICGPGGAGKTSLLLTAAGIQKPADGEVFIYGRNVERMSEDELVELRLKIGFVFEGGGALFHDLTVEENIILPLRYHYECDLQTALKKASAVMEFVRIEEYKDFLPNALPRHIIPRVGFARSLITEPAALFVDDPMRSLDAFQERWWMETLLKLYGAKDLPFKSPNTLVITVSDLREWIKRIDKIAILSANSYKCFSREEVEGEKTDPALAEFLSGFVNMD